MCCAAWQLTNEETDHIRVLTSVTSCTQWSSLGPFILSYLPVTLLAEDISRICRVKI